MFIDSSALVEILTDGEQSEALLQRLRASTGRRATNPMVVYESTVVLTAKRGVPVSEAERLVRWLLAELGAEMLPVTDKTASAALDAFSRFGKGRHPAKLNFGDCFSYASARQAGMALLYVGEDFARMDIGSP